MQSLNWGIIGPGNIAHDFAPDLELVRPAQKIKAVLGHTEESAHTFSREFNVPGVFTDLDTFVNEAGIDIAYIATPHPKHYEQALACLQKKIHILCEKPMTINAEQAAKLIAMSEKNKCFLMEAMWIRFLPSIEKVLDFIKAGAIGKIVSIKASMGFKAPKDDNSRYFNPALGGGSLLDLGIYPVFLAQLLLGQAKEIKAIGTLTDKGIDQSCAILLNYKNGSHAILESSLVSQSDIPAEIAGEKGILRILNPWFEKSLGVELQPYDKEKIFYPCEWEGHGLQFEITEVLRCLQNNQVESELFSHAFSRQLSETMDEIRSQVKISYRAYEKA
jgi:predicted dehydrogenase